MYYSPKLKKQRSVQSNSFVTIKEPIFKRILVPTDLTEKSNRAVEYAMHLARRHASQVTLLHVVSLFKGDFIKYYSLDSAEQVYTCLENRVTLDLKRCCKAGMKLGVNMDFKIVRAASTEEAIIHTGNHGSYDLVVIGSRGNTGLKRLFLGSVAEKVMHQSSIPVLVLHKNFHRNEIRKMLVPVDFSVKTPVVIEKANKIAKEVQAKIELIHVDEPAINPDIYLLNSGIVLKAYPELKARKEEKMQKLSCILDKPLPYTILPGNIPQKICEYARGNQIDLIVMTYQKKKNLKHFLIRSNTEKVVRKAPCPVLSIKNNACLYERLHKPAKSDKLAFGPVPSRRLGQSLGINNIPAKTCSYSCIYCQVGRTKKMGIERESFYSRADIYSEVAKKIRGARNKMEPINYLTFVSDGEPTLDINLGREIELIRISDLKVAVITNASLLWKDEVREDLKKADWVSLKIDTVNENTWHKINRPHRSLKFDKIIQGIKDFASTFNGVLTTETMLLQGLNDQASELKAIADFIATLRPKKSYLAIPIRPPAENWVQPANEWTINNAYQTFKEKQIDVEYLIGYEGNAFAYTGNVEQDLLSITSVHPMREDAVSEVLRKANKTWKIIEKLINQGKLVELKYRQHKFYMRMLPGLR